ncbi:RNA polymerase sigma factor [Chitinophaga defluvii]|uniref:RNA polymerase sigma factor n=1 Tax=Chitinophaga defluvii TaxID=3163343 RepID=A0ABV2T070_9BACT
MPDACLLLPVTNHVEMLSSGMDSVPFSEKELLMLVAEGDERAFYTFYKKYAPKLRAYVWKTTQSEADTEDILQTSFMRIWLSRDKIPAIDNIQAWIYTITAKICLQHFRKKKNEQKKLEKGIELRDNNVSTPFDFLQLEEIKRAIGSVLQRMSPQRKTIYRMNREEGRKPAEIARVLSMPVGTVKNHLSAANKEIRESLFPGGMISSL